MNMLLREGGIAFSATVGLLLIVYAFGTAGDVFLVSGSILFGFAIIAAQLAKLSERKEE